MDNQEIRTLKILEEIDNDHVPSQRELARKLNISLGLVNSFIKRLAHKGYFKITTIPPNRVRYILTPKGVMEKTRLAYNYIQHSFEFYKNSRQNLRKLFIELRNQGVRRVVFFGANDLAEIAYLSLYETPITLVAVIDEIQAGKRFLQYDIKSPAELNNFQFDKIIITSFSSDDDIRMRLVKSGIPSADMIDIGQLS